MTTRPTDAIVLTPGEAAARMGVTAGNLKIMRQDGRGPAYLRLGRRLIRYLVDDVNDWLANRRPTGR